LWGRTLSEWQQVNYLVFYYQAQGNSTTATLDIDVIYLGAVFFGGMEPNPTPGMMEKRLFLKYLVFY